MLNGRFGCPMLLLSCYFVYPPYLREYELIRHDDNHDIKALFHVLGTGSR
uniref:Uncharacterized protein n=1 Tax=Rhizophora mucronata TaxID=61149 RepID=A0A2P2PZJ9_RHIMU